MRDGHRSPSQVKRLFRLQSAKIGVLIICGYAFIAVWGVLFPPYPLRSFPCFNVCPNLPPFANIYHPLGTSPAGMDVFNELLQGAHIDLGIGIGAAAIALAVGTAIGLLSGMSDGLKSDALLGVVQGFLVLPTFVIVVWIFRTYGGNIVGNANALFTLTVILGVFSWPPVGFAVRGEVMRIRQEEFVQASRMLGAGKARILFRHIFPNVASSALSLLGVLVAVGMLTEFLITFLGIAQPNVCGIPPVVPGCYLTQDYTTWGLLLQEGLPYISSDWWISFFPGFSVFLVVSGFVLLGDAVSRTFNPKLTR